MTCEFCGEAECLDRCDWPVIDFVPMTVCDLQVGDQVRRFTEVKPRRKATATVVEIEDLRKSHRITYTPFFSRRVVLRIDGKVERFKEFTVSRHARIRIKRDTKCEKVCCELHRADRGPGHVVCADHWMAWEAVA